MAVAYGTIVGATGVTATSITITKPASTVSGDTLIAVVAHFDATPRTNTPPSGWTLIGRVHDNDASANDTISDIYWRTAGGSEPANYQWSLSGTGLYINGAIIRLTGAHATTPIHGFKSRSKNNGADETSATTGVPAITTTVVDTFGVGFINASDSLPGNNALTNWTNRADYDSSFGGVWTRPFATATTYTAATTGETEANSYVAWTIAVLEATTVPTASGAVTDNDDTATGTATSTLPPGLNITAVVPTPTDRTTTATTMVLTLVGDTFAINDMMIVCVACDNAGASGSAANVTSITDPQGNTYDERIDAVFDNGAASAGIENAIYTCRITTAKIASDDVTINFNVTTAAVAVTIWKIAHDGSVRATYVTGANPAGATTGTPTVTTSSLTNGDTVFGHLAAESNVAVTGDADTTNGSWSTQQTATANTGTAATSVRTATQYKTVTATATQTYNPTLTSSDTQIAWVSIRPELIPRTASGSFTGRRDTAAGSATFTDAIPTASGSVTDDDDTASGSSTSTPPTATASGSVTENDDTATGSATAAAGPNASGTPLEDRDTAAGSATSTAPTATASGSVTDDDDTATGSATSTTPTATASGTVTDDDDTASGSSTSTPPTATATGSVTEDRDIAFGTDSAGLFPTSRSANDRYMLDQFGNPWLAVGDTAWSMVGQLNNADITTYLTNRAAKGVNLIVFSAPEPWYAVNAPNNIDGVAPFTGTPFQSTLNNTYWNRVDHTISTAATLGITCLICPFYLGYSGGPDGWDSEIAAASNANMTTYAGYLHTRYGTATNVMWLIGHDRVPDATQVARADAWIAAMRGSNSQLIIPGGWHPRDIGGTDTFGFGSEDWTAATFADWDFDTQYDYSEHIAENARTMWANSPTTPFLYFEGKYEQEQSIGIGHVLLREQMWAAFCNGAFGVIFGNNPIWHFESGKELYSFTGTWETNMDDEGSDDLAAFGTIVASIGSWWLTSSDTTSTFVTTQGTGTSRVAARFDGDRGLVYHPAFTAGTITLDLTEFATNWSTMLVTRYDPRSGATTAVGTYATSGTQNLSAPAANSAGDNDWLYVVTGSAPSTKTASGTPLEDRDTATGTATFTTPTATASGAITDDRDTATGSATRTVPTATASGSVTDDDDTATGASTSTPPTSTASGTPLEDRDTAAGSAAAATGPVAFGTVTDDRDTATGAATATVPTVTATGTITDDRDTATGSASAAAGPIVTGTPVEDRDTATGSATFSVPLRTAAGTALEDRDTATGTAGAFTTTASDTYIAAVFRERSFSTVYRERSHAPTYQQGAP